MLFRPLRVQDMSAILPLAREAAQHLELNASDLERNLLATDADFTSLSLAADTGERISAFGSACTRGSEGFIKLLGVEASQRRQGIGTKLLAALHLWLKEQGASRVRTDGAAPVYLQPGVPLNAKPALAFFRQSGYRLEETRRSLRIPHLGHDVGIDFDVSPPSGVTIRCLTFADAHMLDVALREHFSPNWLHEIHSSLDIDGASTFVAWIDDQPAAFACAGIWARNSFGPMGTLPQHRGCGLGRALLARSLKHLASNSLSEEPSAIIAWIGPEAFYRSFAPSAEAIEYQSLVLDLEK